MSAGIKPNTLHQDPYSQTTLDIVRPIGYAFDPVDEQYEHVPQGLFPLLQERLQRSVVGECAYFRPQSYDVPWLTSFPAAVQCKHWKETQIAAKEFLDEIVSEIQNEGNMSIKLGASPSSDPGGKLRELLETAVTGTIYMFPAANKKRAIIMAKAILLIFLHDGMLFVFWTLQG